MAKKFPHFPNFSKGEQKGLSQIETLDLFLSYKTFYGGIEYRTEVMKCFNWLLREVLLLHFLKYALTNTLSCQDTITSLKETTHAGEREMEGKGKEKRNLRWNVWRWVCEMNLNKTAHSGTESYNENAGKGWTLRRNCFTNFCM